MTLERCLNCERCLGGGGGAYWHENNLGPFCAWECFDEFAAIPDDAIPVCPEHHRPMRKLP